MVGAGIVVECPECGAGRTDPFLAEIHRDDRSGFGFATFLCPGCGELVASSCPALLAHLTTTHAPIRPLRCSSPPAVVPGG